MSTDLMRVEVPETTEVSVLEAPVVEKVVYNDQEDPQLALLQAKLYAQMEDIQTAQKLYERTLETADGPLEQRIQIVDQVTELLISFPLLLSNKGLLLLSQLVPDQSVLSSRTLQGLVTLYESDPAAQLKILALLAQRDELETIEYVAQRYETLQYYDLALQSYERVVLGHSQLVGDEHIHVAKALLNVARILELQENPEGALDIYRAAHKMYVRSLDQLQCTASDALPILDIIPDLLRQRRFQDARKYLSKCLRLVDEGPTLSKIYLEMGRACMGLQDYVSATVCLVEAAKVEGSTVSDEEIVRLLQEVEQLKQQQQQAPRTVRSASPTMLQHGSKGTTAVIRPAMSFNEMMHKERPWVAPVSPVSKQSRRSDASDRVSSTSRQSSRHRDDTRHYHEWSDGLSPTMTRKTRSEDWSDQLSPSSNRKSVREDWSDRMSPTSTTRRSVEQRIDWGATESSFDQSNNNNNMLRQSPSSSSSKRSRSLRRNNSTRRDERSLASSQQRQLRLFGRRPRGFQSLQQDEESSSSEESCKAPVQVINIDSTPSTDDVSQITMRFDERDAHRSSTQEWWWNVTAQGFGRLFPSSYVTQAVQAADEFLSAKAIHSQSRAKTPATRALEMVSEEDSVEEEDGVEVDREFSSHHGVMASSFQSQEPAIVSPDSDRTLRRVDSSSRSRTLGRMLANGTVASCKEHLAHQKAHLGRDHPEVATTLFTLAILYSREKKNTIAMSCASEALEIQRDHRNMEDAARTMHFLGDLYLHQKQYNEAIAQYSRAMEQEVSYFGFYSDPVARTLNCIGTVQLIQNNFREAMASHQKALEIIKDCHGDNRKHPLVAETLCQIGSVYYRERNSFSSTSSSNPDDYSIFIEKGMLEAIGKAHEDRGSYKMAIAFFEEKLQCLESSEMDEDVMEQMASTLTGLGMLSTRAGAYVQAVEYYEKAVNIQIQLGCDEVELAAVRVLTGSVYFQLGDWHKSMSMLQDARFCLVEELGDRHETVAATHYQIGVVQAALYAFDAASESLNEALGIQDEILGTHHPATLRTRREIGNLHTIYVSQLDLAFEHFNAVLDAQRKIHGDRHPNLAETLHSMGNAHAQQGNFKKALEVLEEAYYMRVDFLGWDHPLQATTLHDIAKIHMRRGRFKKALHVCEVALEIRKEALSGRHIDIAKSLTTKGACLVAVGDTDAGLQALSSALTMAEETVGSSSPIVGEVHTELGGLHLRKCHFDEARSSIQQALDIFRKCELQDSFSGIVEAKAKLERVERDEMLCV